MKLRETGVVILSVFLIGHPFVAINAEDGKPAILVAPFDETAARAAQESWATSIKGDVAFTNSIGIKLRLIPPGEFLMGGDQPVDEVNRIAVAGGAFDDAQKLYAREHPRHQVRISRPFYLCETEITQAHYQSVCKTNPSTFTKRGEGKNKIVGLNTDLLPVDNVSWFEAIEFCNQLSIKERRAECYRIHITKGKPSEIINADVELIDSDGYRLPTEAEWEYACRGGTTGPFHLGNALNAKTANIDGTTAYGAEKGTSTLGRTTNVGSFKRNAFGLFDMHGNVDEWCWDVFDEDAFKKRKGLSIDPTSTSGSPKRVVRGGAWYFGPWVARSAFRMYDWPHSSGGYRGFRVVLASQLPSR